MEISEVWRNSVRAVSGDLPVDDRKRGRDCVDVGSMRLDYTGREGH